MLKIGRKSGVSPRKRLTFWMERGNIKVVGLSYSFRLARRGVVRELVAFLSQFFPLKLFVTIGV